MDRYQYLLVLGGCVLITLPLEFAFSARVYRRPARLLRAVVPAALLFTAWDEAAVANGDWSFSHRFLTGWDLPAHLPLEELLFFLVIPVCALLTFESVQRLLGDGHG